MPFTRESVRESVERAGDDHWRALKEHHEDAYPASRPTPGDVCRAEADQPGGGHALVARSAGQRHQLLEVVAGGEELAPEQPGVATTD